MILLKLFRKFMKFVRGGAKPWQVAVSCFLGVCIGMTPTFNVSVVLAMGAFVLLNLNLGLLLVGLAVGKALCLAAAPVTFLIGFHLIHSIGLEGLFRRLWETPIVAWMDPLNYCFIGGLPVAILVGGAMGLVLARLITLVRTAAVAGGDKSERFQRLSRNRFTRLLLRLLFGKQKISLTEMLAASPPVFRKAGLAVCAVLIVMAPAAEWLFMDSLAARGLTAGLEASVGAEVNVAAVDVSLLTGSVTLTGLQVTDPEKPTHNMVQIDTLTSNLSVRDLLARRFVMDEVVIDRLRTDSPRATPGRVIVAPERSDPPVDESTVSTYFKDGERILDYLAKADDYLRRRRQSQANRTGEVRPADVRSAAPGAGYLRLSADDLLVRRPTLTIRSLVIEEIPIGDLDRYRIEAREVSDRPELNDSPMTIIARSDKGLDATVTLDFAAGGAGHHLDVTAPNIPVGGDSPIQLSGSVPVNVAAAMVDVRAVGPFGVDAMALEVTLGVRDMKADAKGGAFGMSPAATRKVFDAIDALTIALKLQGPLAAPEVHIDRKQTLASITERRLQGLPADVDIDIGSAGKVNVGNVLNVAEELLGKPAADGKADPDKDAASKAGNLIRGLLR